MVYLNLTAALAASASGVVIQRVPFPNDPYDRVLDLVDSTCVENNPVQIYRKSTLVTQPGLFTEQNWNLVSAASTGINNAQVQIKSAACVGSFLSYASADSGAQAIRSQVTISDTGRVWTVTEQADGSVSFTLPSFGLALTGWDVANIPTGQTAPITLEPINATDPRQFYFFEAPVGASS